ncbi:histidine phosphatase family protein [Sphingorhabdus contaminans]|uniref:histidine phosphatase family protein n=1 Tax=Sphingorhabdus contaminans TaxID=1343899 RepID=UPI003D281438
MISTGGKRVFIARHGETVFNKIARMQGQAELHTPLTWDGCVQAKLMGRALQNFLGDDPRPQLWSSTAGRALQTLALIAEEIDADWHQAHRDDRLLEIDVGTWSSRTYADIAAEIGPIVDMEHRLFSVRPEGGEWYDDVARRLSHWVAEQSFEQDMLVICHGMTARVLRGVMLGQPPLARFDAPIAPSLAQGSMVMIRDGEEHLIIDGEGSGERA